MFASQKIIDISRKLHPKHPNWPGDTVYKLEQTASIEDGSSVNVMALNTSTHCGTHLDAPFHYQEDGARLESIALELLMGDALLIDASQHKPVTADVLTDLTDLPERVLFYTGQAAHWESFAEDFSPLTPELVDALSQRGVKLVGTDAPSVDAFNSKDLSVHRAFAKTGLIIVEGLNLHGVAMGRYQLICLPLNMPHADASPVRAVLLENA